jgi:broad specificity phosphatase PhoE
MTFYEKKYLKYKKKYFDLKGSAPPVNLNNGETITISCNNHSPEHTLPRQGAALFAPESSIPKLPQPSGTIKVDLAMLAGKRLTFYVKPDDTILSLKEKFMENQGIPIYQQKYMFRGIELKDKNTFSSYEITDNSTIHLILSLKPVQPADRRLRVYVMRHADRADDDTAPPEIHMKVDREEDTPLWPAKGEETARRMTNDHLMKPDGPIDLIVSSPLLRCIQTAVAANQLIGNKSISIDNGLCEVWHRNVLKGIALREGISAVKMRTPKELEQFGINTSILKFNTDIKLPPSEETRGIGGTADSRFRESIKRIAIESVRAGQHKLLIISHGDCVDSFVALCTSKKGSVPTKSIYEINYGAIVVADYHMESDEWTLIEDECHGVGIMDE